jgi:predicted RNA-binding Zn-ribbon protein involved in translation (DUF1610 family)
MFLGFNGGPMPHTYTITCCTTKLDIYSKRQSRCPECGRVFITRDHKESGYRVEKIGRDSDHESS